MPDPLRDLSMFAENAVSDIELILQDYAAAHAASAKTTPVGRYSGSGSVFGDRATQFAVANIVGIVEYYAEQILLGEGCNPKAIRTWGDKPSAWKKAFGADIEDAATCPSFTKMRGFYEARNAIVHQRGELTHSQRNRGVYVRLAAARIERVGYRIVVTESTVRACAKVCGQCIKELDKTTKA